MSNPFKASTKAVKVDIDYVLNEDDDLIVIDNDTLKEAYGDKVKTAKATFKREDWSKFNNNLRASLIQTETGAVINHVILRDIKLRTLLEKLVDGDGNNIEINRSFFDDLDPDFGLSLMAEYDNKIGNISEYEKMLLEAAGKEDEKKDDKEESTKDES